MCPAAQCTHRRIALLQLIKREGLLPSENLQGNRWVCLVCEGTSCNRATERHAQPRGNPSANSALLLSTPCHPRCHFPLSVTYRCPRCRVALPRELHSLLMKHPINIPVTRFKGEKKKTKQNRLQNDYHSTLQLGKPSRPNNFQQISFGSARLESSESCASQRCGLPAGLCPGEGQHRDHPEGVL